MNTGGKMSWRGALFYDTTSTGTLSFLRGNVIMRRLSLKQPYAGLLVSGRKTIEIRK